jgi:serine/threonine-protein kinase
VTVLGGRYETLKTIASGGMGTVFLGRAVGMGGFERLVAIKLMHPHIAAEPEFVSMFLDEARLAALIRHPNVVPTIDFQESDEALFLVMEYVEGPSLKHLRQQLWRRGDKLPVGVTLRMVIDLLAGLHAAHEQQSSDGEALKLVHRDVSPPNILVGSDGVTRITDFGVARAETRLSSTRGGQLKGKLPYMAPEQLLSEPIDRRCDIYAAGVVLWEDLAGMRLFSADSEGAVVKRILAGADKTPRAVDESLPQAIDEVCMTALRTDADQRFSSAAAFAEALELAAEQAGVTIATARAVGSYLERNGLFQPLDLKALAAGAPVSVEIRGKLDSVPRSVTPRSSPLVDGSVTVTDATVTQAKRLAVGRARSRLALGLGALAAVVVGGAVALSSGRFSQADGAASAAPPAAAPESLAASAPRAEPAASSASPEAGASAPLAPSSAPKPTVVAPPVPRGKPRLAPAATSGPSRYDPENL